MEEQHRMAKLCDEGLIVGGHHQRGAEAIQFFEKIEQPHGQGLECQLLLLFQSCLSIQDYCC